MSCPVSCPDLQIRLRPIQNEDADFLFRVYASTREAERSAFAWAESDWNTFLREQFALQHAQYMRGYINPSFDLILKGDVPVGRLYVDRQAEELRIIEIALLPEYRRQGVGGTLLRGVLNEARESGRVAGLHVERDNPVLPFYERLGFHVVADKGVYLYMRASPPEAQPARQIPDSAGFLAHLHSDFAVQSVDGARAKLCLEQVECKRKGSCEGISLLFSGPATLSSVHASYVVSHPVLGEFPLFLGPVLCRVSEPPACSSGAKPPPVGAKKILGRPGDFLESEPPACSCGAKLPPMGAKKVSGRPGDFPESGTVRYQAVLSSFNAS